MSHRYGSTRRPVRAVERLMFPLLLFLTGPLVSCQSVGVAEPPPVQWHPTFSPAATPAPSALTLNLEQCLHLALERQPRIAAQRISLAAAEKAQYALETLRLPGSLDPQIPIRCRQASLGVAAAAAGLDQAQRETIYAVTRTYFTVLYAREQDRLGKSVVEHLTATRDAAQQALDDGVRDVTSTDVNRASVYLHMAESRRTQATQGIKRALVALREAVGLEPTVTLNVPADRYAEPEARPNRDEVIALTLARRGDLMQVQIFVQVACLEVEAQATSHHQRMQTFASGADIHARQVSQGVHNSEYRPGGIPTEMPALIIGNRAERVEQARVYHARAIAVVETTRKLVALEAEDAFLRWEEAAGQARQSLEAADTGDKLADQLRKDFAARLKVRVEEVITARALASQARSEYLEFVNKQILALADLERVTAGGFSARLIPTTTPQAKSDPAPAKDTKANNKAK